jgi:hypothetical protein
MRQPLRCAIGSLGRAGTTCSWTLTPNGASLLASVGSAHSNEAARRCEAVLFLISKARLGSAWCKNELNLARRLNKRLFGILIEEGLAVCSQSMRQWFD